MQYTLLFSILSLASADETLSQQWKELYATDGWVLQNQVQTDVGMVTVSKKLIDYPNFPDFPCFRGEITYPKELPPALLIQIAADAESAKEWSSAGLSDAITLERNAQFVDYHQFLPIPVFADRYWFNRGYFEKYGEHFLFRWERLAKGGPYQSVYENVRKNHPHAEETIINEGAWVITPVKEGTHIFYIIATHPGGSVPVALQSIATEGSLPTNVSDIIREAERRMASP